MREMDASDEASAQKDKIVNVTSDASAGLPKPFAGAG